MWKRFVKFYHQMGSPKEFYRISAYFIPWFAGLFFLTVIVGAFWGLVIAPADYQQGEAYRIIFVHVPAAWSSLFIYVSMAIAAIGGFIWRIKTAFMVCVCSAPIGAAFTLIALATGSLWGKPMWGTWWVWDARLTSELILFFLYLGVFALYHAYDNKKTGEKAAAILSIVGAVNVPIIHYSVVWWNSLHQTSTVLKSGGPAMPASMLWPLLLMAFAFKFYYGWILFVRMRHHILTERQNSAWAKQVTTNHKEHK